MLMSLIALGGVRSRGHLSFEQIKAPEQIYGRRLYHPAHQSDVLRLQKLMEHGGYYLDCDVLCVKPFGDLLLGNKLVMGKQANDGLCNAVMLSPPKDKFMRHWHDCYKTFRSIGSDQYWDEHSVRLPAKLAKRYFWELRVLPADAFFYPIWGDMPAFMTEDRGFSNNSYTVHLWETFCWSLYENLTPHSILTSSSEFARLAKHLL
jgi:glycosyl transferase-like sugar-binding protein